MSLPDSWVNEIFQRLALVYGHDFLRRWEGLDMGAVKADWARELSGFARNPQAIKHALDNLPPAQPPTVLQFRALCIGRPETAGPALPAPKADPNVVAAVAQVGKRIEGVNPKAWAHRMRVIESAPGNNLTAAQRAMWRAALGEPGASEAQ